MVIEERTELVEERGERKEERRAGKKAGKGRSSVVNQEPSRQGQPLSSVSYITAIEDRRNYIIRKSQNLSKQSHIIAANVDQAFLVVTIAYPETSTTFIDRFLASAEAYSVPVVLLFNKVDLLDDDGRRLLSLMINLYETIGYECRAISAQTGEGVSELFSLMEGKITLLSGNSGVGKSTLINRLVPGVNLRTAEISDAHNTGMHTTTFSEMIPLCIDYSAPNDGCQPGVQPLSDGHSPASGSPSSWLIDTPGIKGFGTFDMQPEEITSYFKEIFLFSKGCRFSNCTHTHEPGCAVLKAIDDHYIAPSRYQSYLSMLDDKDDDKYRAAY
ncbi:MAG: ribosome small subunit-dependent GTPase A [Prevotella sp.]|nr:ribosome small subunit-dependent GTPase A [Prevotella sp.]